MVSAKTVLVIAVIDSNFDTNTSIDQANDSGWDTDVVGCPSVGRASKSRNQVNSVQATKSGQSALETSFTQQRQSPNHRPVFC
jgi:hypothetical protein